MTARPAKVHKVKCWPGDFEAIRLGVKTCEIRRCDDRDYRVGDVLEPHEYDPNAKNGDGYTGRLIRVRITHVDRMAGPLMIAGVAAPEIAIPLAALSFGRIST